MQYELVCNVDENYLQATIKTQVNEKKGLQLSPHFGDFGISYHNIIKTQCAQKVYSGGVFVFIGYTSTFIFIT